PRRKRVELDESRDERALGVELVVIELPDERRPVDGGRAEARDGRVDVVDDAVAADRLDAGREAVQREPQWKYWPPSMTIVWPVTNDAAGPARYATAPTTSAGSWSRWIVRAATETSRSCSITSGCSFTPSDIVNPGATQFTRMPSRPSSRASARVNAT